MTNAPTGTVTFLFTDIEGSTRLWESQPEAMRVALARHDTILRNAVESHDGHVFKTIGDAFCTAFGTARDALAAAIEAQRALRADNRSETGATVGPLRVRMALQTGAAELRDSDYFGPPLNRVARLLGAAHGGQVLLALPTVELVRDALPDGVELRDLGDHRLKDLARPEHVFQALHPELPSEFPRLRTLDLRPNNLPAQATPLVGREKEVASARELLLRPDVRLLTMTGPGGTGKTRLALQVAADLIDHFEDGVFFVPLAPTSDLTMVAVTIARQIGVQEAEGRPLVDILRDYLHERRLLLVLDNFEQVLDAASLVADLLSTCPRLKVLVTSRAVLHLYGGHTFPVPPLELPDPRHLPPIDRMSQYEAVRLFIERARAVKPDFAITNENAPAVAEICHRLDGLPLAIELAAARVRLLAPQAILTRLERRLPLLTGGARDLPARQQTLRGAIAWGYDLLEPAEQLLFRRLSVFAGGCTLEAVEAVCNPELDLDVDVLDGIASLADKSLLRQEEADNGEPRFRMLETIREYGSERLDETDEAPAIRRRHAELYLALAEEGREKLHRSEQASMLRRLTAEHENLRAALSWLSRSGEVDAALRLAGSLWWYWFLRGELSEGRRWLQETLALADPTDRSPPRLKALFVSGVLAFLQSDYPAARAQLETSAALMEEIGDWCSVGYARLFRGQLALFQSDLSASQRYYELGIAACCEAGDCWGQALGLFFLANGAFGAGDLDRAETLCQESIRRFREVGDRWQSSLPMAILARVALLKGDHATAKAYFDESMAIRRESGDKWGLAHQLNGAGDAARLEGDYARARAYYEEARGLFEETSSRGGIASVLHNLGYVARGEGDEAGAATRFLDSLRLFRELGDARGAAECLAGLAGVLAVTGSPERAARLFGASEALLESIHASIWPGNRAEYERNVAIARAALDEQTFAAAWAEGRSLTADQAVALAWIQPVAR